MRTCAFTSEDCLSVASIVDVGRSIIGFAIFDLKLIATDAQFRGGDAGVCSYFGLM